MGVLTFMDTENLGERTFLLTWKPEAWPLAELVKYVESFETTGEPLRWSVGNRRNLPVGSRVFLAEQGKGERGVFGSGFTVSETYDAPHYSEVEG